MLQDRSYMRRDNQRNDRGPGDLKPLYMLVIINFILLLAGADPNIKNALTLNIEAFQSFEVWRPVTALFMHEGFMHLFFNMFGLYFFGIIAAQILGGKKFLGLYFFTGVFANLFWLMFNLNNPFVSLLGASGAVMGIIMAAAMMRPDIEAFIIFIPVPIKLKTLAVVYIIIELISQVAQPYSSVAYLAHIGGFIAGYLFMAFFAKDQVQWDPLHLCTARRRCTPEQKRPSGWRMTTYDPEKGAPVPQFEIDRLLDKLSRTGINSLTEAEQETLRRAREEMMKR